MISGRVTRRGKASIELVVIGPEGDQQPVSVSIDTGFSGHLTLPWNAIGALQLPFLGTRRGLLADGSVVRLRTYRARVDWHGRYRPIVVFQAAGGMLLGMALLRGNRLIMEVIPDGNVTIEEVAQPT